MTKDLNKESGRRGEKIAARYLHEHGYKVVERNYRTRFGEIDLVCTQRDKLVFVEVKLKIGDKFGTPEEMITKAKVWQVRQTAEGYLLENYQMKTKYSNYQIDAVCVVMGENDSIDRVSHYENIESEI